MSEFVKDWLVNHHSMTKTSNTNSGTFYAVTEKSHFYVNEAFSFKNYHFRVKDYLLLYPEFDDVIISLDAHIAFEVNGFFKNNSEFSLTNDGDEFDFSASVIDPAYYQLDYPHINYFVFTVTGKKSGEPDVLIPDNIVFTAQFFVTDTIPYMNFPSGRVVNYLLGEPIPDLPMRVIGRFLNFQVTKSVNLDGYPFQELPLQSLNQKVLLSSDKVAYNYYDLMIQQTQPLFESAEVQSVGNLTLTQSILSRYFSNTHSEDLHYRVFAEPTVLSNVDQLTFTAIKNVKEPEAQSLVIDFPGEFDIEFPDFMNNESFKVRTGHFEDDVYPVISDLMDVGTIEDFIRIKKDGETIKTILVRFTVIDEIEEHFDEFVNFTRDNLPTLLVSPIENGICKLGITLNPFQFFGETHLTRTFNYKNGFLNQVSEYFLGDILSRLFPKITSLRLKAIFEDSPLFQSLSIQLLPFDDFLSADFTFENTNRQDTEVFNTHRFLETKWVRGRIPFQFEEGSLILHAENHHVRVTPSGFILTSFIRNTNTLQSIDILKNGEKIKTLNQFKNFDAFGVLIKCSDFLPGDIIKVVQNSVRISLNNNEEEDPDVQYISFSKSYSVFPKGPQSNMICYITEYGKPALFEFTGQYSFNSKYEFITQNTYQNLVEQIRNLDSSKSQKLTINTGFILKENTVILDQIIRSERVWLVDRLKREFIELKPNTNELSNYDSLQEYYQFDIEFEIVKTHDLKVYPYEI